MSCVAGYRGHPPRFTYEATMARSPESLPNRLAGTALGIVERVVVVVPAITRRLAQAPARPFAARVILRALFLPLQARGAPVWGFEFLCAVA